MTIADRTPRQDRSIKRVQRLLEVAAELIVERGVNGFALSMVAKRTGTAQGSLYQFFGSREELIGRLHATYATEMKEIAGQALKTLQNSPPPLKADGLVDTILTPMAAFYRRNPAYRELRHAQSNDQTPHLVEGDIDAHVTEVFIRMLTLTYPSVDGPHLSAAATLILEVGDALLSLTAADTRGRDDALVYTEGRRLLVAYLEDLSARTARSGHQTPDGAFTPAR